MIFFKKSGEIFAITFSWKILFVPTVICRYIRHLSAILQCIINSISDRHCIMHVRLVFDAQKNVRRFFILFDYHRFENITVFLYGIHFHTHSTGIFLSYRFIFHRAPFCFLLFSFFLCFDFFCISKRQCYLC